jgi:DNA-binding transcriptional LysR family regulator
MRHVLVSQSGDTHGFIDEALRAHRRARRIVLTVPNFIFALSIVSETDLITGVPHHFAAAYAKRFDFTLTEVPVRLPRSPISAIASKSALADGGVTWLMERISAAGRKLQIPRRPGRRPREMTG